MGDGYWFEDEDIEFIDDGDVDDIDEEFGEHILQLKIWLRGERPPIWRRIQISDLSTFWDLHVAIQDVMEWGDFHPHEFHILDPRSKKPKVIGTVDRTITTIEERLSSYSGKQLFDPAMQHEYHSNISNWLVEGKATVMYDYDYRAGWEVLIKLEKTLETCEEGVDYPRCLAGKRSAPPEDCGGPYGFRRLLEYRHSEEYDPDTDDFPYYLEEFFPELIKFRDPQVVEKESSGRPW